VNLFESLNPQQKQGVLHTEGPVLVIAGAGSGKTKMLTSRIAHLIGEKKAKPHEILAVTFTNKAAGEMRERVAKLLGLMPDAMNPPPVYFGALPVTQPLIGTFHSICTRILRNEMQYTPFRSQFVIYDDSDQISLIKECMQQLQISDKTFSPKSFQFSINSAKCQCLEPQDIAADENSPYMRNLVQLYELYQRELHKNNAVDFGEIITLTVRILHKNPELLEKYQQRYRYLHVDEYQDTNRAQYLLVRLLASGHRNVCVVGDEDQSIYKWRGADIRNILDFEKDYPEATIIKLEQNYRSTQTIIEASSKVISHNTSRKPKTLWTENQKGEKIKRFQVPDDRTEAEVVVSQLKQACENDGFSFNDVAVFYRTNAQSRVLEDILRRERVPYRVIGGLRFYDRKEIKDIISYFRALMNPADTAAIKRIINVPARSIGPTTVAKVESFAFREGVTLTEALRKSLLGNELAAAAKRKVTEFVVLMEELREMLSHQPLTEMYHFVLDRSGYLQELKTENTEESRARIENLQEFFSMLTEFEEAASKDGTHPASTLLPLFLENIALVGEQEAQQSEDAISLMTLHTSKGLEYPLVYMVGVEEGLFPSIRNGEENDEDIEEERRLCYVGMTRAKERLTMTHALCRRIYGNILYHEPARFFGEIPEELVEFHDLTGGARRYSSSRFSDDIDDSGFQDDFDDRASSSRSNSTGFSRPAVQYSTGGGTSDKRVGKQVRHKDYGLGIVLSIEGRAEAEKITIEFAGRVTRKFVTKFAPIEFV